MSGPRDSDRPAPDLSTETADGLTLSLDPDVPRSDRPSADPAGITGPWRTQPEFGERYQLIETIGRGGMGDIYRAYDRELREEVALKVLREDRADQNASLERFRRELSHARRVTHANVLRVYDIGEIGGRRFLSMQYVDGEDLAKLMKRGRLGVDRALGIFRQVCDGLIAAHAEGVIHRDLKPQNVLLDKTGRAYIADFGIARSMEDPTVTMEGSFLGSPAYMSPEQVKGEATSAQSDVYSLGVLLYHLLTGELPFQANSTPAIMMQRLKKKPRPLREVNPEVPPYLEKIADRCMAVSLSERYASVRDVVADLDARQVAPAKGARFRRRAAFAASVVIGLAAVAVFRFLPPAARTLKAASTTSPPSSTTVPAAAAGDTGGPTRVLVLGVDNRTGDPLFDGTLDVVMQYALRRSTRLDPLSGNDLRALASEVDPEGAALDERLGEKLAAKTAHDVVLVRGIVSRGARGFTLSLTATSATTHAVILSRTEDAESREDIVPSVASMASALRTALGEARLDPAEASETGLSRSLEADHDFAFGEGMINAAGDSVGAVSKLEHAVLVDPAFAMAHYLLGIAYNNTARRDDASREFDLAQRWVDRMGKRDRLQCIADTYEMGKGDFARAVPVYREILASWPMDSFAETNLSVALIGQHRYREALQVSQQGLIDHPRNPIMATNLAQALILTGDFEAARQRCEAVTQNSSDYDAYETLAVADVLLARRAEAVDGFKHFEHSNPSVGAEDLADQAIAEGRLDDAVHLLDRGLALDKAAGGIDNAERKRVMMGEALARRGDAHGALAAVHHLPARQSRLFRAGMVRLGAGDEKGVKEVASKLRRDATQGGQTLAALFDAEVLRSQGKASQAVPVVRDALRADDAWLAHFVLGEVLLDAGQAAEAAKEFQVCVDRRGEGAWAFPDGESVTLRYVPRVTYWLARADEELGSSDARRQYEAFLAMEPEAQRDPLAKDARRRLGGLK
jgi:eukaryotic-like serine/threonine-protein kinase